jgi:hypothetical protein
MTAGIGRLTPTDFGRARRVAGRRESIPNLLLDPPVRHTDAVAKRRTGMPTERIDAGVTEIP